MGIQIKNLTVKYGNYTALENVHLHIPHPGLFYIIGPNGGGKTTLLKAILGQVPYQGEITIDGVPAPTYVRQKGVSYSPQGIIEALPINLKELGGKEAFLMAMSPGQRQAAFLDFVLSMNHDYAFLDEPDSFLDPKMRRWLKKRLLEERKRKTVVVISHDISAVMEEADGVMCVNKKAHVHSDKGEFLGCTDFLYHHKMKWIYHDGDNY